MAFQSCVFDVSPCFLSPLHLCSGLHGRVLLHGTRCDLQEGHDGCAKGLEEIDRHFYIHFLNLLCLSPSFWFDHHYVDTNSWVDQIFDSLVVHFNRVLCIRVCVYDHYLAARKRCDRLGKLVRVQSHGEEQRAYKRKYGCGHSCLC
ncbi:hypothetical protein LguiA_004314 [Lonicera macranthoides]